MAITRQSWCDFVVVMNHEDIHIERNYFDPTIWEGLEKKLLDFYLYAMVPELQCTYWLGEERNPYVPKDLFL